MRHIKIAHSRFTTVVLVLIFFIGSLGAIAGDTAAQSDVIVVATDESGDYTSIQQAVDRADSGDKIRVQAGTYNQSVSVYKDVIISAPNGATITNSSQVSAESAFKIYADATVSGFTLTDWKWGINGGGSSSDWTVSDFTIRRSYQGISGYDSSGDWIVEDTTIQNASVDGITVQLASGNPTIRNTSLRTVGDGIDGEGFTGTVVLSSISIRNISDDGIDAENVEGELILENTTIHNAAGGNGLHAPRSSGEATIRDTYIETVQNGIFARQSGITVQSSNLTVVDATQIGIEAVATTGDWTVQNSVFRDMGVKSIDLSDSEGNWEIHDSILTTGSAGTVDAMGAGRTANASFNYWGAPDGPSGQFNGSGGEAGGNIVVTPYYSNQSVGASISSETNLSWLQWAGITLVVALLGVVAFQYRGDAKFSLLNRGPTNTLSDAASTTTDNSEENTASAATTGTRSVSELRAAADSQLETAITAEENDQFEKATNAYRDAIEHYRASKDRLAPTATEKRNEIVDAIESTRSELEAIEAFHEQRTEISELLKPAERSFQEAVVAATDGDLTISRIRFRQARDSFEDALKLIETSENNLLSPPIEVTVEPARELSPTTLAELPVIPETAVSELADTGIETVDDLETDHEPPWTPPTVVEVAETDEMSDDVVTTLTLLSWWHDSESHEFDTLETVSRRQQQADYGFNYTT